MEDPIKGIKRLIWVYFFLLLFEGVLRKWIFPALSDYLFLARDPVVFVLYVLAWRAGYFPSRPAMVAVWTLGVCSLLAAVWGETPLNVTIFGLRTNYLHLPMIFIMGDVLDRDDVMRLGRWWLWLSLPILALMVLQFQADPSSTLNVGAGGREMGQLTGAMGRIRPPGPFSFISGVVSYFTIAAAFVLFGWMHRGEFSRRLMILASLAVLIAIPISISRSLLFGILVVSAFAGVTAIRHMRRIPFMVGPALAVGVILLFFADSVYIQPMIVRWSESTDGGGAGFYGSVIERLLDEFTRPFAVAADAPLLGHGVGMGTVAGARLMTGKYVFLLSESELARIVLEIGPILGFAFIVWRTWLSSKLVFQGWNHFIAESDELPWLLAGTSFLPILNGQWGPATQLGFAVFGAGLALAAMPKPEDENKETADEEQEADEESEDAEEPEEAEEPEGDEAPKAAE